MNKLFSLFTIFSLIFALTACAAGKTTATNGEDQVSASAAQVAVAAATPVAVEAQEAGSTVPSAAAAEPGAGVAAALAENQKSHADVADTAHDAAGMANDATVVNITLAEGGITVSGEGASVDGSTVTITAAGTYGFSGSLTDGQIRVDTDDDELVRLVLYGVELRNATSAPIYIVKAEETVLILAEDTVNTITDGATYEYEVPAEEEPNAAIYSKSDLTIAGNGTLVVNASFNDGITSKDGLVIAGGTITVDAADDGIRGKDYLIVNGGSITVNAGGDGLKSDNETDADRGYILVTGGVHQVTAAADALDAQTDVLISAGELNLTSGGGGNGSLAADASAKGIKGTVQVVIDGGAFTINSADDAIHSNGSIVINNGAFVIASGDDGMHADATLEINGGTVQITQSYEGIESAVITINGGEIHVLASDDGLNVASGMDGSGMAPGMGRGNRQDAFANSGSNFLYIHGGYLAVQAGGDGLDANGTIEMTGGVVLVNGPTQSMNGALDYGRFMMSGGSIVAAGSAGMAQPAGSATSSQYAVLINFTAPQKAGTLVHIQSSDGKDILTFAPSKQFQSITFSLPALAEGETYNIYLGGSAAGDPVDSLYPEGIYSPGSKYDSFTISAVVTTVGSGGFRRP